MGATHGRDGNAKRGDRMSLTADTLLLFGATGDLARRKLLPEGLRIVGTARSPMTDAEYRNFARAALEKFLPADRRGSMADFLNRLHYQPNDVTTLEGFDALATAVGDSKHRLAIFLSTAPSLLEVTIEGLRRVGLT